VKKTLQTITVIVMVMGCITQDTEDSRHKLVMEKEISQSTSTTAPPVPTTSIRLATTSTSTTSQPPTPLEESQSYLERIGSFEKIGERVCEIEGKPIIRAYGKIGCHGCEWSDELFDEFVKEYEQRGLVVGRHWLFDTRDDTLTPTIEETMPESEYDIFFSDDNNPSKSLPYFNFGCIYSKTGNSHMIKDDKEAERKEYVTVIEEIIKKKEVTKLS